MKYWYCEEKFEVGHSWDLKVKEVRHSVHILKSLALIFQVRRL